jgi:hypothetical protein
MDIADHPGDTPFYDIPRANCRNCERPYPAMRTTSRLTCSSSMAVEAFESTIDSPH